MSEAPMRADRKLRNRIIFKLTGRWPQSVVSERLSGTTWDPSTVNAIMAEVYAQTGDEWVPLTGNEREDERRQRREDERRRQQERHDGS